ncbi:MAG: hypothetical protein ACYTFY_11995 [Planctomycetota bacterium]|jgi:hypothetical protein
MSTPTTDFRYAALWQWNPVSSVSPRSYDEKHMVKHNDWFFDQNFMSNYFDKLLDSGMNSWILANTHPFPYMVDMSKYKEAVLLNDSELDRYRKNYHWLFETAVKKGIKPFVLFHTCYVPDEFGLKYDIKPLHSYEPSELAYEYTSYCVQKLCEEYPELEGINGEASENVNVDLRSEFAKKAIVSGVKASGQRPVLFFRGWISDPEGMKKNVMDEYDGECFFTVKYTWEHLIHSKPDPEFMKWIKTCSGERIIPEFWISNFQPFGCRDLELAENIHKEIKELGCPGFTSHPMDMYGAPFVQGEDGVLQIERDKSWFATLSGIWQDGFKEESERFGISDAAQLKGSYTAASSPFVKASYYVTGNKQNFTQPQLLGYIAGNPERRAGLMTLNFWKILDHIANNSFGRFMEQIDDIKVMYPGETRWEDSQYDLGNLIEDTERLLELWQGLPESAEQDDKVYQVIRKDTEAQYHMAHAWLSHIKGVYAYYTYNFGELEKHFAESIEHASKTAGAMENTGKFRLLIGRHVFVIDWQGLVGAMQEMLEDAKAGFSKTEYLHGTATFYETQGKDFAE